MRGIVIWVSSDEYSALIWCEDSREIAVAKEAIAWRDPAHPVAVGDYVGFACRVVDGHRLCRDVHVISAELAPDLARWIRSPARPSPPTDVAPIMVIPGAVAAGNRTAFAAGSGNRPLHLCASHD